MLRVLLRSVVVHETAGLWDFSLPAGQLLECRRSAGVNRVWGSPARHDGDMQRSYCTHLHKIVFEGHSQSPCGCVSAGMKTESETLAGSTHPTSR